MSSSFACEPKKLQNSLVPSNQSSVLMESNHLEQILFMLNLGANLSKDARTSFLDGKTLFVLLSMSIWKNNTKSKLDQIHRTVEDIASPYLLNP